MIWTNTQLICKLIDVFIWWGASHGLLLLVADVAESLAVVGSVGMRTLGCLSLV